MMKLYRVNLRNKPLHIEIVNGYREAEIKKTPMGFDLWVEVDETPFDLHSPSYQRVWFGVYDDLREALKDGMHAIRYADWVACGRPHKWN